MAKNHKKTWLVIADNRRTRLLQGSLTAAGSPHLEESGEIDNAWEEREHGRPGLRMGAKSTQSYPAVTHEKEEEERRYAGQVATWLDKEAVARQIDAFVVFAPDRLLGTLRKTWSPKLRGMTKERHGDFAHLTIGELTAHPAITAELRAEE
jgi:protein required for attachment to host cells